MADRTKLKIGDEIRLFSVPVGDMEQRRREKKTGVVESAWTANAIELIIAQSPIVKIDSIDEYGQPW